MMDNKLSELSKPVAWKFKNADGGDRVSLERKANIYGRHDFQPLYSQEYVSALLAERDAFEASALALRDEWRASKKSNAFLKEQLAQLANFNPDWDMLEACRESWREVAAALKEAEARLVAKDKRIAELSLLLAHNIERSEAAEAKLATPVRLPAARFCPAEHEGSLLWSETESHNKAISDCAESLRATGFVVERGEQDG
ncbi:hypothetical protein ABK864_01225 [Serratia marcescens]|uniref:hypothetical protein n=1 Tax=Serratia marcescens TaxID=615 RepID=UPI00374FC4EE